MKIIMILSLFALSAVNAMAQRDLRCVTKSTHGDEKVVLVAPTNTDNVQLNKSFVLDGKKIDVTVKAFTGYTQMGENQNRIFLSMAKGLYLESSSDSEDIATVATFITVQNEQLLLSCSF